MNVEQYAAIITPEKLTTSFLEVDAAIADVVAIGAEVEKAYENRGLLVKAVRKLEGEIEIAEATAFMQLNGDTVQIDGNNVKLSNDKLRDMYRKYVTRDLRQQLAEKEADLKEVDVKVFLLKDKWDTVKKAADIVEAKTWAQSNLLKFLSSRG